MDECDEIADSGRICFLRDTMPEIENVTWAAVDAAEDFARGRKEVAARSPQPLWVEVALNGDAVAETPPGFVDRDVAANGNYIGARVTHGLQQVAGAAGEQEGGHTRPAPCCPQRIGGGRQRPAPVGFGVELRGQCIEQLNGLCAGTDLPGEHSANDLGQRGEPSTPRPRMLERESKGWRGAERSAAAQRIRGQGEGRCSKTDEGHAASQHAANTPHRVEGGCERLDGGFDTFGGAAHVGRRADRPFKNWTPALNEVEAEAKAVERKQDIGENDRGIHLKRADRLQGDLGGQIRVSQQFEHRMTRAKPAVFGHVAAGLAHEPHRRAVGRPSAAGKQKAGRCLWACGGGRGHNHPTPAERSWRADASDSNARRHTGSVDSRTASVWAVERNATSKAEGGKYTPPASSS